MRVVDQKGIVAVYRVDLDIVDIGTGCAHDVRNFFLLSRWEQDIGGNSDNQCPIDIDF